MRSGASGVACLDAPFNVSAARAREYRLYSVLSIICASCERATLDAPETIDRSDAVHRMSLLDNLRRLTRERVPTILRATPDRAGVHPVHVQRRIALQHPFSSPTPHVPFRRTFFSSPPPAPASPKFARPSPVPASDNSKHLRRAL